MILTAGSNKASVMPIYRRMCRFNMTVILHILFTIHMLPIYTFTILTAMREREVLAYSICRHGYIKRAIPGKTSRANVSFILVILFFFYNIVFFVMALNFVALFGRCSPKPRPLINIFLRHHIKVVLDYVYRYF